MKELKLENDMADIEKAKELLKENQWSRQSPTLSRFNRLIMTCPVCCCQQENRVHDDNCWLGQALSLLNEPTDQPCQIFNCEHFRGYSQSVPMPFGSGSCSEPLGDCAIESENENCCLECPDYQEKKPCEACGGTGWVHKDGNFQAGHENYSRLHTPCPVCQKPVCETCNDTKLVDGKKIGKGEGWFTCPDCCQQPPDPDREFVDETRKMYFAANKKGLSVIALLDRLKEACSRLNIKNADLSEAYARLDAQQPPASELVKELWELANLPIEQRAKAGFSTMDKKIMLQAADVIYRQNKEHKQLHEDCAAWMDKAHEAEAECGKLKAVLECCLQMRKCDACEWNPKPKYVKA